MATLVTAKPLQHIVKSIRNTVTHLDWPVLADGTLGRKFRGRTLGASLFLQVAQARGERLLEVGMSNPSSVLSRGARGDGRAESVIGVGVEMPSEPYSNASVHVAEMDGEFETNFTTGTTLAVTSSP